MSWKDRHITLPTLHDNVSTHHVTVTSEDDILRKFWEVEESPQAEPNLSLQEKTVLRHFNETHTQNEDSRFIVPLPKNPDCGTQVPFPLTISACKKTNLKICHSHGRVHEVRSCRSHTSYETAKTNRSCILSTDACRTQHNHENQGCI